MAVSSDGRFLATASYDRNVCLWDTKSRKQLRVLRHPFNVTTVTFINDRQIATGTREGNILIWEISTGAVQKHAKTSYNIEKILSSPDGKELWGYTSSLGVFSVNIANWEVITRYQNDLGFTVAKSMRDDGAYVVVRWSSKLGLSSWFNNKATVEWWHKGEIVGNPKSFELEKRVTGAAITPDGSNVLLGTEDGMVHRFYGPELSQRVSYSGHRNSVDSMDISLDQKIAISASQYDSVVLVRSLNSGEIVRKISKQPFTLNKVQFTTESDEILMVNDDGNSARLFNISSGKDFAFRSNILPVFKIQFSPDYRYLLTGNWDYANLWDLVKGEMTSQFANRGSNVVIASDGKKIFSSESLPYDSHFYLSARDIKTGKEIGRYPHKAQVTAAVYSADKEWLATGDSVGEIHLWNTRTGKEVKTFSGHSNIIITLTFGPENTLLSHSRDYTARAWNIDTGNELWREDALGIDNEAFSRDGTLLAAWSGGELKLFDVKSHKELKSFNDAWTGFVFTEDKGLLFVNEKQSIIEKWSPEQQEPKKVHKIRDPHTVQIFSLSKTQVLVCESGTADVIDWSNGSVIRTFQNARCSQAGPPFIFIERENHQELWNALTNKLCIRKPISKKIHFEHFTVSENGRYLATTNDDFLVEIWDIDKGRRLRKEEDTYRRFDSLRTGLPALAANGDRYFVTLGNDMLPQTAVNEWELKPESPARRLFAQPYAITSLDVSPDGKQLVTCGGDSALRLFNAKTGKLIPIKKDAECWDANFSQNGELLIRYSPSKDSQPQFWARKLDRILLELDYRPSDLKGLSVSSDGRTLLTSEGDGRVRVWDLTKGAMKAVLPVEADKVNPSVVELVEGGRIAIVAQNSGDLHGLVTSYATNSFKYIGHKGRILSVQKALNNDQFFVSVGEDGSARVWDALDKKSILVIENLPGSLITTGLSFDGELLLLAKSDATIQIWDVKSKRMLNTFNIPTIAKTATFSPNKANFVFGDDKGIVRVVRTADGQVERELKGVKPEPIISVEYWGRNIVTTSSSGSILWGNEESDRVSSFSLGAPLVTSRVFVDSNENMRIINAGAHLHYGYLNNFVGFQESKLFYEFATAAVPSPDGRLLAVGYSSGWLRIWNVKSRRVVREFRPSDSSIDRIKISKDGESVLLSVEPGSLEEWDIINGKLIRTYGKLPNINDLTFAGSEEQFVVSTSSDGRVRFFDRIKGNELFSLISGANGEWVVVTPDGLFEGSREASNAEINSKTIESKKTDGELKTTRNSRLKGLLSDIISGKIFPMPPFDKSIPNLPEAVSINFDKIKPTNRVQNSDEQPIQGEGLRWTLQLFAGVLKIDDKLEINKGIKVETSPDGRITLGMSAIESIVKGQSLGSSIGITAFIVAHEAEHSKQALKYKFGNLSVEDHRLLECQADVLGTIKAINLVVASLGGTSDDAIKAYAAIRNAPELISAIDTLEGNDLSHPNKAQRQWAIIFGNARLAARVLKDEDELNMLDHRFDAGRKDDDEIWSQNVCKRILNYQLANQSNIEVSLLNQRKTGYRWEAEVVYRNLTERSLKISAHITLTGSAWSLLDLSADPTPAIIDGYLTSFILPPKSEKIETVSLAEIKLPGENFVTSGILYNRNQEGNFISVEFADNEMPSPKTDSSISKSQESSPSTCVENGGGEDLTPKEQELGEFLFNVVANASDDFLNLRQGNPLTFSSLSANAAVVYNTNINVFGGKNATITVEKNGATTLRVPLGRSLTLKETDELFKTTETSLRRLCPESIVKPDVKPGGQIRFEELTISKFARRVNLRLQRTDYKSTGTSEINLIIETRK